MRPHEVARLPRRNREAQPIYPIGRVFDLGTCRQGTGWDPGESPLRGSRYPVMLLQSLLLLGNLSPPSYQVRVRGPRCLRGPNWVRMIDQVA